MDDHSYAPAQMTPTAEMVLQALTERKQPRGRYPVWGIRELADWFDITGGGYGAIFRGLVDELRAEGHLIETTNRGHRYIGKDEK